MYQTCIIAGNLGGDAELRYMPSGDPVCSFSVATSRVWTDRDGNRQERTTWFRVSLFGRQAQSLQQYLTKGKQVLVEGTVDVSAYTAQDGTPRATLELRANNVRLLGRRGDDGGDFGSGSWPRDGGSRRGSSEDWMDEGNQQGPPTDVDEIPF